MEKILKYIANLEKSMEKNRHVTLEKLYKSDLSRVDEQQDMLKLISELIATGEKLKQLMEGN